MPSITPVTMTRAGSFALPAALHLKNVVQTVASSTVQPDAFDEQGNWYRLLQIGTSIITLKAAPTGTLVWTSSEPVHPVDIQHQVEHIFSLIPLPQHALEHLPERLAKQFADLAPLVHIASPTLGEALIKGIIRQVISASQAKKVLHQFVTRLGSCYDYANLTYYNFPTLEQITQLPLEELSDCGLGFKAKVIKHVAQRLLEENFEQQVLQSSSPDAVLLLQKLKGIGDWTAHVAICDFLHDWSQYPFGDLAVRKWAKLLWKEGDWPVNEDEFEHAWRNVNGEHAGLITIYLFTSGKKVAMLSIKQERLL